MTYSPGQPFPGGNPNQPSPVTSGSSGLAGGAPSSNLGWAIAGAFFLPPLAFAAFASSVKVDILWRLGDFAGAEKASADAKKYGSLALWIGLGLLVLGCVVYAGIFAAMLSTIPADSGA